MREIRRAFVLSFIVVCIISPIVIEALPRSITQAIDTVDVMLVAADSRSAERMHQAAVLGKRASESNITDKSRIYLEAGRRYRTVDVDSSLEAYGMAVETALNKRDKVLAECGLASVLPMIGAIKEAIELYESADKRGLDSVTLREVYVYGFDLYSNAMAAYGKGLYYDYYRERAALMTDSLLMYSDGVKTPETSYYNSIGLLFRGQYPRGYALALDAVDRSDMSDALYGRIASLVSEYHRLYTHKSDAETFYLALAAASDLHNGTRETTALQRLGVKLFEDGDINRASEYLSHSLKASLTSGAKIRTLEGVTTLPYISAAQSQSDSNMRAILTLLVVMLVLAMVVMVMSMISAQRSKRAIIESKHHADMLLSVKDDYIKAMVALSSDTIERLEEFSRYVVRRIKAGQAIDLSRELVEGHVVDEQVAKFHNIFDDAIFRIYPNFVDDVNALFAEDKKISLVAPCTLTPELRVLAFMRLGVTDSNQIASFLGLSLNTVYTYRNRLRNRAESRENFEHDILNKL